MTDRSAVHLVDKPVGPTSHDVVAQARRTLGLKKIGHTGTLDPFASGLLLLCVGAATRLVEYFHVLPKTYEAEVVFGEARDTDDRLGEVVARAEVGPELDAARLEVALEDSVGPSRQRPPDYSARRKDGVRAYEAARAGQPLALEARPIEVLEARLLDWTPPRARVIYTVSTGTYIRALARDLGEALACPAHLGALRRTSIGPFDVDSAPPPAEIGDGDGALSPLEALSWLPSRELTGPELVEIRFGRPIEDPVELAASDARTEDSPPVALSSDGRLVAVGRRGDGLIRPEKVFDAV